MYMTAYLNLLPPILLGCDFPKLATGIAFFGMLVRPRAGAFLLSIFVLEVLAYTLIATNCLHGYGPRFLYEGSVIFFVLAGFAMDALFRLCPSPIWRTAPALVLTGFVVVNGSALREVLPRYKNYNGIDTKLLADIRTTLKERAVYLVDNSTWQGLEIAATIFDYRFRDSIFLRITPEKEHLEAVRRLPWREYRLYYFGLSDKVRECNMERFVKDGVCSSARTERNPVDGGAPPAGAKQVKYRLRESENLPHLNGRPY
jgi:hypothetical protein